MKVVIDEKIISQFPALRIGIVIASIDKELTNPDLRNYCLNAYVNFIKTMPDKDSLNKHKNINIWRETYRMFGVNPKKKIPTAEAFLSRVIKSNYLPEISPIVDSYLVAECLHCLPIGGYDLTAIRGDITLRYSCGNEHFKGIGAEYDEFTEENEIVYADDSSILTRRWNYRDAEHASIRSDSRHVALFTEAPSIDIEDYELIATIEEIAKNLRTFCGAETQLHFIDVRTNNSIELF